MPDGEIARIFVTVGAELKDFQKGMSQVSKTLNSVGKDVTRVGKELTRSLTLPLLGIATASIASSSELFEVKQVLSQIKAPLKSMGESIAMLLLPSLRVMAQLLNQVAGWLKTFINWLGSADPAVRGLIVALVALAVTIGPILKYGGLLIRFFSMVPSAIAVLTGPIGILVFKLLILGAGVLYVVKNWDMLLKSFSKTETAVALAKKPFLELAAIVGGPMGKVWNKENNKVLEDGGIKLKTFGEIGKEAFASIKGVFSGMGDMIGTELPKKFDHLHNIAHDFFTDFATQAGQSFSFFKQGSFDIGKAFESAVDAMAQKLITSGLLNLVSGLFGMPGDEKKGGIGIGGGIAAGAALGPIGAIGGGLLGLFGFDSPRNDQMAFRAGQSKWMRDFQSNFSDGYVSNALSTVGAMPSGGGGSSVSIDMRSMYNFDTSARSRQASKELRNNIKRKGAI